MHRRAKRDPRRKAPSKSTHALYYIDRSGKRIGGTTTFVTPAMRAELERKQGSKRGS